MFARCLEDTVLRSQSSSVRHLTNPLKHHFLRISFRLARNSKPFLLPCLENSWCRMGCTRLYPPPPPIGCTPCMAASQMNGAAGSEMVHFPCGLRPSGLRGARFSVWFDPVWFRRGRGRAGVNIGRSSRFIFGRGRRPRSLVVPALVTVVSRQHNESWSYESI